MKKIAYGIIFLLSLLRLEQQNIIKLLSERYDQTRAKIYQQFRIEILTVRGVANGKTAVLVRFRDVDLHNPVIGAVLGVLMNDLQRVWEAGNTVLGVLMNDLQRVWEARNTVRNARHAIIAGKDSRPREISLFLKFLKVFLKDFLFLAFVVVRRNILVTNYVCQNIRSVVLIGRIEEILEGFQVLQTTEFERSINRFVFDVVRVLADRNMSDRNSIVFDRSLSLVG